MNTLIIALIPAPFHLQRLRDTLNQESQWLAVAMGYIERTLREAAALTDSAVEAARRVHASHSVERYILSLMRAGTNP